MSFEAPDETGLYGAATTVAATLDQLKNEVVDAAVKEDGPAAEAARETDKLNAVKMKLNEKAQSVSERAAEAKEKAKQLGEQEPSFPNENAVRSGGSDVNTLADASTREGEIGDADAAVRHAQGSQLLQQAGMAAGAAAGLGAMGGFAGITAGMNNLVQTLGQQLNANGVQHDRGVGSLGDLVARDPEEREKKRKNKIQNDSGLDEYGVTDRDDEAILPDTQALASSPNRQNAGQAARHHMGHPSEHDLGHMHSPSTPGDAEKIARTERQQHEGRSRADA